MNSPPLCCPLFIYLLNFFSLLSNGLTSVFLLFDLVGTALAVLTHFFKCLQLLFLAICSRHIGLYIFFAPEKNNNKQTNGLTNGSQIWEDSDLQMSLITSAALPISLSLCLAHSRTRLSLHPQSLFPRGSDYLLNLCVLVASEHMHVCAFRDCERAHIIEHPCPCVIFLTWQPNVDVLGRGPAPLPLSANR